MSHADSAHRSVVSLAGIGANTAARLEKLGIFTLQDLIFHLPLRYEDRTHISPIGSLKPGVSALIKGTVALTDVISRGRKSLIVKIGDGTGMISLRFFHFSAGQLKQLTPGTTIGCFGEARYGYAGFEMVHPEYSVISSPDALITESRLTPVYPLTEGVRQSTLRKAIKQALSLCQENPSWLNDWLPPS
ncbi:MAG: OB-fold nucleic acid binding domain-containing protein, partial [Methylicorpusculum sp.]|nr:OB-fold nucleic acid binding domain-containing protein [Methylicorpusculum sp.]